MLTAILKLIRWQNLVFIVIVQTLIKYCLLEPFASQTRLDTFQFTLLVFATLFIVAASYIINVIFDIEKDKINNPEKQLINNLINEDKAFNLYLIFNVIGIGLGFYLSYDIGRTNLFVMFVLISALAYVYASFLKRVLIVGNLIVALIVGLVIILVGVFDILTVVNFDNRGELMTLFWIITDYAVFALVISFIIELVNNIVDIDGDYHVQNNTLPIVLGRDRAANIALILCFVPILAVVYYISTHLYKNTLLVIYFLVFILGLILFLAIKLYQAEHKNQYVFVSKGLKLVILFSVLSMALYPFVLKN